MSEEEIISTLFQLGRVGLYVEPTAAVAPAGETTVIPLTGSGLKAGSTIAEMLKREPH